MRIPDIPCSEPWPYDLAFPEIRPYSLVVSSTGEEVWPSFFGMLHEVERRRRAALRRRIAELESVRPLAEEDEVSVGAKLRAARRLIESAERALQ